MSELVLPLRHRRTWMSTVHVLTDLWAGVLTFAVVFTLLVTTLSLAVTLVLVVPFGWLTVVASRQLGRMERARARVFLDLDVRDPHRALVGGWWSRLRQRATSGVVWREIAYHLVLLPAGAIGWSLVLVTWSGSMFLAGLPGYVQLMPDDTARFGLFELSGVGAWAVVPFGLVGLVWLAPWTSLGWARIDAALVRTLLGPNTSQELAERVETLTTTRALAVDAAEEERRRIERDLHDGAQQRLVALAIELGMARAKFDSDPEAARALLEEAHEDAKRAIAELRDLARGIHPVALTDRGLAGAIPGLADRAPFPVEVKVDVAQRPVPAIEGIAYFVVSESLTNIAKHSGATRARIVVVRTGDRLVVEISDDGRGGADLRSGTGLRGLSDRAAAVDGTFSVDSPLGGPTVVRAELPCVLADDRTRVPWLAADERTDDDPRSAT
jgi:signal transduction histidine kinase